MNWPRCLAMLLMGFAALLARAETGERVALVIGNSAYPWAPLSNPRNDARAMADLLRRAGFMVDQQQDTSQPELSDAVARFGKAITSPKVKFGLFYYAGHGLQQEWRNYLVPVSAEIRSAEDVRKKTVDVSALLAYMERAKGRSFLVILDACRDDPFAGTYRPPAKGLSQFDAPAGSLLAYSTAPGSVALDGEGPNGLYTGNLLREFSVPGVRIEDAFKRVRLNVRMASRGLQVPWESTSLEEDVYLFPSERRQMSDEEQDRQLELEIGSWLRVKSSHDPAQLADFIRRYPSGSASELAQARLNRLLAVEARLEAIRLEAAAASIAQSLRDELARIELARVRTEETEARRVSSIKTEDAQQQLIAFKREAAQIEAARTETAKASQLEAQNLAPAPVTLALAQQSERQLLTPAQAQERAQAQAEAQARREAQAQAELQVRAKADTQAQEQARARAARADAERMAEVERAAEAARAADARVALQRLNAEKEKALARLAAETERAAQQQASLVKLAAVGVTLPSTPFSQGLHEHRRSYQRGDVYNYRVIDAFTNASRPLTYRVTAVDLEADRVEYNDGEYLSDTMGNILTNPRGGLSTPRQFYPAELFVGKRWHTTFKQSRPGGIVYTFQYDLKVVGRESITVPAGTFDAFKIEARGYNMQLGARLERNIWVTPGVSGDIAHEILVRLRNGSIEQHDRQELVSFSGQGTPAPQR